jgi:hypothetical protein
MRTAWKGPYQGEGQEGIGRPTGMRAHALKGRLKIYTGRRPTPLVSQHRPWDRGCAAPSSLIPCIARRGSKIAAPLSS